MRAVVQRVRDARVEVDTRVVGSIKAGLLVYLGIGRNDDEAAADGLARKIVSLRVFPDADGKMNLSLQDLRSASDAKPLAGSEKSTLPGILVVSQFTLFGDVRKGRRPSYNDAAPPDQALPLYRKFLASLEEDSIPPQSGVFQEHMDVRYTNDGPVTILIDTEAARQ